MLRLALLLSVSTYVAGQSTFRFFAGPSTYSSGRASCQALGGDLASIHSAAENAEAIALAAGRPMRIGLSDSALEGSFVWSDGTQFDFSNWDSGQPASDGGDEDCVSTFSGYFGDRWHDAGCDTSTSYWGGAVGYLCRNVPPAPPGSVVIPPPPPPPVTSAQVGAATFTFIPNAGSWDTARASCAVRGGELASIHSAAENAAAWALVPSGTSAWIGLTDEATEGTWEWIDGSSADYVNFQTGEPNQGTNENCAGFYSTFGGSWADGDCTGTSAWWAGAGAICRSGSVSGTSPSCPADRHVCATAASCTHGSCPSSWQGPCCDRNADCLCDAYCGSNCNDGAMPISSGAPTSSGAPCAALVFNPTPLSFSAAEAHCVSLGGHLATIGSAAIAAYVDAHFVRAGGGCNPTWIGFSDRAREGTWTWLGGSSTTFTDWWGSEPNDMGGGTGEDCASLGVDCLYGFDGVGTGWVDSGCEPGDYEYSARASVCQITSEDVNECTGGGVAVPPATNTPPSPPAFCTVSGVQCPLQHQDADMGGEYARISTSDRWNYRGVTDDGRPWYECTTLSDQIRYLYYSARASGFLLTATAPQVDSADAWTSDNNQVRLNSGGAQTPGGTWASARLYCGHDTDAVPAAGCSRHARGDSSGSMSGLHYFWCDNSGPVTVTCQGTSPPLFNGAVTFTAILDSTVEEFNAAQQARYRQGLSRALGVAMNDITLTIEAASIVVIASIAVDDVMAAMTVRSSLAALDARRLSQLTGASIEVLYAPDESRPSSGGDDDDGSNTLLVLAAVGGLTAALLAAIALLVSVRNAQRRKVESSHWASSVTTSATADDAPQFYPTNGPAIAMATAIPAPRPAYDPSEYHIRKEFNPERGEFNLVERPAAVVSSLAPVEAQAVAVTTCSSCGVQLHGMPQFCPSCGSSISAVSV